MKKCGDFDSYGPFFVCQNNLSGIGKRNGYSEFVLKIGFAGNSGDNTYQRAGKVIITAREKDSGK